MPGGWNLGGLDARDMVCLLVWCRGGRKDLHRFLFIFIFFVGGHRLSLVSLYFNFVRQMSMVFLDLM